MESGTCGLEGTTAAARQWRRWKTPGGTRLAGTAGPGRAGRGVSGTKGGRADPVGLAGFLSLFDGQSAASSTHLTKEGLTASGLVIRLEEPSAS